MTGRHLGCFRLGRELGSGGMGMVHAATVVDRCPGLDEGDRVALKIVHPHLLEQPGFFRRFLREAEIGASVHHPNVVCTYLADALGTEHFLVMEYVEGQTLRDLLEELDRVPEELCRHIGREVAKGLAAIHGAGVVHRDIKPENVLITPDHVVKVMDLGVARLQDEAVRLSQTGAFVGSLQYAAPEAFRDGGAGVDGRADLHALGLLLYELACGVSPYLADDIEQTVRKVLHEDPRRLGEVNPQLSPFFEEVVHCLLAKDRDERFASAQELLSVLEAGEHATWWSDRARTIVAITNRPLRRIRIPRETAVYGRDKDLARLRRLYEAAKSGEGQVVLIEGEAGIGKSRLVDELIGRLQADGEDLHFLFGSYPPGGAALASGGFSSAYREQFGDAGAAPYLEQTPLLVPAFDAVLHGEPAPKEALPLTRDSLATCFVHATRNLAAERPTVVLIEDLHFAPDEARALFLSLALALALRGDRVLLIGTMRPGVSEDWVAHLARLDYAAHMELSRLGPKDLAALLQDSFRSQQLAEQLSFRISTKSDGNPFFAFEIIRGLREGHFITEGDDGTWVGTRVIDEIQIPSSVLDLVNARIADLDDEDKDLLEVASCWGYEFDPALVAAAAGIAIVPALKRFGRIEKSHRLVRGAGRAVVFDHHQVQEALYAGLLEQLREHYHGSLADALAERTRAAEREPETLDGALCVDLCTHYMKGARGESALRYLGAAQEHLGKGHLHAQVVALTERALAVPELLRGVERVNALVRMANALDSIGDRARQEECAREAEHVAEETGDDEARYRAAAALTLVLIHTSRPQEAEVSCRRALALARARGDRRSEALATGQLGIVFWYLGRLPEAQEHYEREIAICRELHDRTLEAGAVGNIGNVLQARGYSSEARVQFERSLVLFQELGQARGVAQATGNLGNLFLSLGSLLEARECHERHLAQSREIGNRQIEAVSLGNLGTDLYSLGCLGEALELHERHLALSREIGFREGEAYALGNIGWIRYETGETARAEEQLAACIALSDEIGHRFVQARACLLLGSLRAEQSNGADGRELLLAARDLARDVGLGGIEVVSCCELALRSDGSAADIAAATFARYEERLSARDRQSAHFLLWRATGERSHLAEAKRLLDDALSNVPEEHHEAMCRNLRVNREILAAWREEFGEDDDSPSESRTRVRP